MWIIKFPCLVFSKVSEIFKYLYQVGRGLLAKFLFGILVPFCTFLDELNLCENSSTSMGKETEKARSPLVGGQKTCQDSTKNMRRTQHGIFKFIYVYTPNLGNIYQPGKALHKRKMNGWFTWEYIHWKRKIIWTKPSIFRFQLLTQPMDPEIKVETAYFSY